jgi:hypothetical protein
MGQVRCRMSSTSTATGGTTTAMHRIARAWNAFVASIASLVFTGVISILLGFTSLSQSIPAVALVHNQPAWALGFGLAFVLLSIFSFVLIRRSENPGSTLPNARQSKIKLSRVAFSTIISTTSFALFAALLATVLIRPSWCPTAVCPAAGVVYAHNGVHDSNLELYFTDLQGDYYALPGDVAQYTAANAPHSIGVVRTDTAAVQPYRLVFTLHSVRRSGYDIIIENIVVHIQDVPITPRPLNVWMRPSPQYLNYPFLATYSGQVAGATLPSKFDTAVPSLLELGSGEADTVGLQVASASPADVRFTVSVQYRVANEATISAPLTLPGSYEVIFTSSSNWHLYSLVGNHFISSSS